MLPADLGSSDRNTEGIEGEKDRCGCDLLFLPRFPLQFVFVDVAIALRVFNEFTLLEV